MNESSVTLNLCPGDWVEVKSEPEIEVTLDEHGRFESLPFMPEMRAFCGHRFRVFRSAERTCIEGAGMFKMKNVVYLEDVRCDGSAHGGCDRGCLIFWKEAWLKKVSGVNASTTHSKRPSKTSALRPEASAPSVSKCQAVALPDATSPLRARDVDQYIHALRKENASLARLGRSLFIFGIDAIKIQLSMRTYSSVRGPLRKTPTESLNLQPGEPVIVKSADEILATLDANGQNRGLNFSREMFAYCNKPFRVRNRVNRIILEANGTLKSLANTVILEGVTCTGCSMRACPRAHFQFWREIWLRRP